MNAAHSAARGPLAIALRTASTGAALARGLLLLAVVAAGGSLHADDGLALVPEFEVVHADGAEKMSHTSLTAPNQKKPAERARLDQLVVAGADQRVRERCFTQRFLCEIEFTPHSQTDASQSSGDASTTEESEEGEIRLCASPPRQAPQRSINRTQLSSYFLQDETGSTSSSTSQARGDDAAPRDQQLALTLPPVRSLDVEIDLPGGGPLPPDMTDWRGKPYCVCPDCPRPWGGISYCFCATCFYTNPLYFEEINLERYGYGCHDCLQPFCSAAHFFGRVPLLPCMMIRDCPSECNYTLGHYRPGSCNPWRPVGCCGL